MGGFTAIYLKDTSEENIMKQNELLRHYGVAKKYGFYSEKDIQFEYDGFCIGTGVFPEHLFPKDKIKSYNDFKRYWSPKALGECFVPYVGSLTFDCYFGRTSKRAMRGIGKYLADNYHEIKSMDGSFETFFERGMTRLEMKIMHEAGFFYDYERSIDLLNEEAKTRRAMKKKKK